MSSLPWTADTSGITADSGQYLADDSNFILYPNVPPFPGVPPLNRVPTSVQQLIDPNTGAAASQTNAAPFAGAVTLPAPGPLPKYSFSASSGGATVPTPDSVVEVDVKADSEVMSHPIEQGQFEAYNRVQDPIGIRLLLAYRGTGGTQGNSDRQNFLSTLESLREGTELITISTPDAMYANMALKSYGYRKSADHGMVTLWVDTEWVEGRSTGVSVSPPPTAQPQGASTSNLGSVQPQTLTAAQSAAIASPPVTPSPLPAEVANEAPSSGACF
jgi:hypothetical protein